nr:reverse transcriptase domain-containing protein [Tanacetum cinerariifolium]
MQPITSLPLLQDVSITNPDQKGRVSLNGEKVAEMRNLSEAGELTKHVEGLPRRIRLKGLKRHQLDRFKDILRACPHHGFSELHQLDTFYSALNLKDQDSLNSVAGVSTNTSTSSISPDVAELKDMVKALLLDKKSQNQSLAHVKAVEESCVTCGGAHSYRNCPATDGNVYRDNIQEFISQASAVNYNQGNTSYRPPMIASTSSSGTLPSNTIAKPRSDLKAITTRSGVSYDGPRIPPPHSFLPKVVENEPETTNDIVNPTNNESTEDVQPQPVIAPVSAPKPNPKSSIPYPSRRNDERNREKANNQIEKFCQIFKDMSFEISFADAFILMPKFASTLKALIGNKEKLSVMARTPLNEHCSPVLLKKLPKKLGDPGKFLIPCDFPGMAECLALADLGASINLMPFSVWQRLSLPDLTPTFMTLELADRSISRSVRVAEDVYVKVGSFHFSADFVVVDFDADPRVPLILKRSFLKTRRALIDVFEANYSDMTAKRINVIDMACEEYSQEVLGFFDIIASGNLTPYYDPIVSTTSPTLTPFENSDFLLEEVDAFLAIEDDPTSPEELKTCEAKSDKSSIDEPLEFDLKDLPLHLEYAFLEGDNKLPVIITKDLSVEEKTSLITVLKSHKRAITWKLSDIKGIDPKFCTHKILMDEDFEPAVQHQRRVNPKIHDVIKQEVIKLLKAGLIYPISDSPWVNSLHCVPKNGGFAVVENEDNELIPTHLVMERLAGNQYYCFLDGFSGYFQITIDLKDQEKTTFTYPYETFAYRRMPFGLCNAPVTFQRCMMEIFHDMIEKTMEVFMDDFSVFRNSFQSCLSHLERMLKRYEDTNLCLNWEKSHFMVKEGIVLGHKTSKQGIEVDKAKVDVITKLPHPTNVKAPILIAPDWDMPFELMCDASDFAIGAVLGKRQDKHFSPIHYASKTMTEAESNYTTTEKEMLAVVYAFEKFWSYLIMNKSIVY